MPLTLNGSGTIAGLNAGGLPDACITTDDIAANAVTFPKMGTTEQGQLCKAWVNFNGTGTVAIRASYNVSSITDAGVGNYVVNFVTAMPDVNYTTVGNAWYAGVAGSIFGIEGTPTSTTSKAITTNNIGATAGLDTNHVCVAIFR